MRSTRSLTVLFIGLLVLATPFGISARSEQPYIVVFKEAAVASAKGGVDGQRVGAKVSELARRHGVSASNVFGSALGGFAANLTDAQVRSLHADPAVEAVIADELVTLDALAAEFEVAANVVTVSSPRVPAGIRRVGADQNSTASINGKDQRVDVDVAILDTGIDKDHPDLNIAGGYNCTGSNRDNWRDRHGHGTHVAGTVAALDNGFGVVGVAPGARLWAIKVMGDDGSGLMSWIICGIDWVTARRDPKDSKRALIEVANMSLRATSSTGDSRDCGVPTGDKMHAAICRAVAAGTVFVAAAGNDKKDARFARPAAYDETITVSAMVDYDGKPGALGSRPSGCTSGGSDDAWASYSNFGDKISLIAPGTCVLSTYSEGRYAFNTGTSMSAPHVTGGAALYLARYPNATPQQVRMALQHVGTYKWRTGTDPDGKPDKLLWVAAFDPPPDFSAAGALGNGGFMRPGTTAPLSVSVSRTHGHTARVAVSVTGLPSGITAGSLSTSGSSGSLDITVSSTVASGRYTATLRATDGELVRTRAIEIGVDGDAPTASFSFPAAGSRTMQSATSARVSWSESDGAGSGVAERAFQRQRGRPSAPGDCSATQFANDGSVRTAKQDYTESLLHNYCYRWRLDLRDRVGNSASFVSGSVLVDTTAPARPAVALVGATSSITPPGGANLPAAWANGQGTIWFRGGGSGRIDLLVSSLDPESGIGRMMLAATTGTSGWSFPSSVTATADDVPVRLSYGTSASTLGLSMRAVNGAGVTSNSTSLTVRPDSTAPTDATWTTPTASLTISNTGSVQLAWTGGSDSGSGLADAFFVRRQRAPVTSTGGCGSFTSDGPALVITSGSHDSGLKAGYCYRWRLRATDRVGNLAPGVLSGRVRVDATAPVGSSPPSTSEPTVTSVSAVPAAGTRLTTSSDVRVRVSWSASAGSGSLDRHEVRHSTNGGASWSAATATSGSTTALNLILKPGATYLVAVRSRNTNGVWSEWVTAPSFGLSLLQGEGSAPSFTGTWTTASVSKASAGAVRHAKSSSAVARLTFTGRSVALVSTLSPKRGKADIYIDGKLVTTIDLYAGAADHRRQVFTYNWSTAGSHTIEVRVKGTSGRPRVDVDAFVVFN